MSLGERPGLVETFLRSDPETAPLLQALRQSTATESAKGHAVIRLLEASLGACSIDEAVEVARKAYTTDSTAEEQLLLILFWLRLLLLRGGPSGRSERVALFNRARDLVSPNMPAEIQAWYRFSATVIDREVGDSFDPERTLATPPPSLSTTSPHFVHYRRIRVYSLLLRGMGGAIDREELELLVGGPGLSRQRGEIGMWVDAIIRGDFALALQLYKEQAHGREQARGPQGDPLLPGYEMCRELLGFWCQYIRRVPLSSLPPSLVQADRDAPPWLAATRLLLQRRPQQALELSRLHAERSSVVPTTTGLHEYVLIRAELACGNAPAARRLLTHRRRVSPFHYIDDFFWTRVHLLEANRHEAAQHLAQLLSNAQVYRAYGRVDFEFLLATELSVSDLALLSQTAAPGDKPRHDGKRPRRLTSPQPGKSTGDGLGRIVHRSRVMARLCQDIQQLASESLPVLITGETGTGKELVGRALHDAGPRSKAAFLAVNCGAIAESIMMSELFGHRRGSFTGADTAYRGLFVDAENGTLFLDEIGDISPALQLALLRVLETGEVRPLGSSESHRVACRIVAATNADLSARVAAGRFREDLYYRLQRLHLRVPPLRERPGDIPILVSHLLNIDRPGGKLATASGALLARLGAHHWPGNVRELRNLVETMRVLNSDKLFYDEQDLDSRLLQPSVTTHADGGKPGTESRLAESVPSEAASAPPGTPASTPENETLRELLARGSSRLRRMQRLRKLLLEARELKTTEAATLLGVSRGTAARYLKTLESEGFIVRIAPSKSTRSSYYALAS